MRQRGRSRSGAFVSLSLCRLHVRLESRRAASELDLGGKGSRLRAVSSRAYTQPVPPSAYVCNRPLSSCTPSNRDTSRKGMILRYYLNSNPLCNDRMYPFTIDIATREKL